MPDRNFKTCALGEIAMRCKDSPKMIDCYELDGYDHLGQDYRVEVFDWVGWRGVFTQDLDCNTVELVAKDPDKAR